MGIYAKRNKAQADGNPFTGLRERRKGSGRAELPSPATSSAELVNVAGGAGGKVQRPSTVGCGTACSPSINPATAIRVVCPQNPTLTCQSFRKSDLKRLQCIVADELALFPMCSRPRHDQGCDERMFNPNTFRTTNEEP